MSDSYGCRGSSRALPYPGNQTVLHDCYFENSAAEFMDTLHEYEEDHQENLSSPVPADLAHSQFSGERRIQRDIEQQQSPYSRSQDPAQQRFHWNIQEEKVDAKTLSNSNPLHPQTPKADSNHNLQSTHKYQNSYAQQSSIRVSSSSIPAPPQTPSSKAYLSPQVNVSSSSRINDASKPKPWTATETHILKRLHSLGRSWEAIARALPGRSESSCRQRYERVKGKHRASVGDQENLVAASEYNNGEDGEGRGRESDEIVYNESDGHSVFEKGLRGEMWTAVEDGLLGDLVARGGSFGEAAEMLQRSIGVSEKVL